MNSEHEELGILGRVVLLAAVLWAGGVVYALMRVDAWTTGAGALLGVLLVAFAKEGYRTGAAEAVYGRTEDLSHVAPLVRGAVLSVIFFGPLARLIIETGFDLKADKVTIVKAAFGVSLILGLIIGAYFWIVRDMARDARERSRRDTA